MIPIAAAVFGVGLICFGLSRSLWLSLLMMLITGFGMMQGLTASNTILQTLVDEKYARPRNELLHHGVRGHGSVWQPCMAGALAHAIGAPRTVIVSGIACIFGSFWFWSRLTEIRYETCGPSTSAWGSFPGTESC